MGDNNLEFFTAAILTPALEYKRLRDIGDNIDAELSVIEAVNWALLGVQIGYLAENETQELISSSEAIFRAWSNLWSRNIITRKDDWGWLISHEAGGPLLNKEVFSFRGGLPPRTRESLHKVFQTFLLLTEENIFDDDTLYFLNSIGWTDDEEWGQRKNGTQLRELDSASRIASGFANVLNYWEELSEIGMASFPPSGDYETNSAADRKERNHSRQAVFQLVQDVRRMTGRRFRLDEPKVIDRYFVLAGELVGRTGENSPGWLDARRRVFQGLLYCVTYAGDLEIEDPVRHWNQFLSAAERFLPRNDVRSDGASEEEPRQGFT